MYQFQWLNNCFKATDFLIIICGWNIILHLGSPNFLVGQSFIFFGWQNASSLEYNMCLQCPGPLQKMLYKIIRYKLIGVTPTGRWSLPLILVLQQNCLPLDAPFYLHVTEGHEEKRFDQLVQRWLMFNVFWSCFKYFQKYNPFSWAWVKSCQ